MLVVDYSMYIDNIQYFNWIIFFVGMCALVVGWYFVMVYLKTKIIFAYACLKQILKIFPLEYITKNRYIISYLENVKTS